MASTSSSVTEGDRGQVAEKAQEVAGQVQEKAGEAAEGAKSQLRSQVDRRSTEAGQRVGTTAADIRSGADQLRQQGKQQPARLAEQAADRAERLGDYLRRSDGDRILHDVEDAARRRPWAVAAGCFAIGFVASRVLKASSSERYRGRSEVASPPRRLPAVPGPGNGHSANPVGSTGAGAVPGAGVRP